MFGGNKSIGESEWKPHNWNIETNPNVKTATSRVPGPDWSSKLRCAKPTSHSQQLSTVVIKKHLPDENQRRKGDWTYYLADLKVGKRCIINGEVKGNLQTSKERNIEDIIGSKKKVEDRRNGITCRSPGDKSYAVPEYSIEFHKEGSTLPAVNFSRTTDVVADTFIPLQPLPKQKSLTFLEKEDKMKLEEEKLEVEQLNEWTPAAPITPEL